MKQPMSAPEFRHAIDIAGGFFRVRQVWRVACKRHPISRGS